MDQFFRWPKIWEGVLGILILLFLADLIYLNIEITASRQKLSVIEEQLAVLSFASSASSTSEPVVLQKASFSSCFSLEEASQHIGEEACVEGKLDHLYVSQTETTFLNFCPNYQECSFQAVIFASRAGAFSDLEKYEGKNIQISGLIKTYQGKAEIIINDPSQIKIK